MRSIAIVGGTGFVGRNIVNRLSNTGQWKIKLFTRRREKHRDVLVLPNVELITDNIHDQEKLNQHLANCDVVVNLVGILNEKGKDGEGFRQVHVNLTQKIINACQTSGVKRLLHMSALNADAKAGKSHYLRTKGEAEALVHAVENINVTSFRPSVIFGRGDIFLNNFATLLKVPSYLFMLPSGHAKFAPVWVNDVVDVMLTTIDNPATYGQRYNLCGPKVYTLQEIVQYVAQVLGKKRLVIPLNDKLSSIAANVMEIVPTKPYSKDNYLSAQVDSVCDEDHFAELGITAHAMESIVPRYFNEPTHRARYSKIRCQAGR